MKVVIHKVSKIPMNHRTLITLTIYPGNWFLRTFFWFLWKQETKQFGTTHEINLRDAAPDAPLNVTATTQRVIQMAKEYANEGFGRMENDVPIWIPSSQIAKVRIVFETVEADTIPLKQD